VVCAGGRVVGYTPCKCGVPRRLRRAVRRNMPDPVPVMIIGAWRCRAFPAPTAWTGGYLRDAVVRTVQAAEIGGIRAILVPRVFRGCQAAL